jgi:hypothetical protein
MENNDKYLNFFGDSQNYKLHNPLPNPYGLRGNPDLNANSADQGDGLNGTPDYRSFTGEVQDGGWSNHPGFISGLFGGGNNNSSDDFEDIDNDGIPDTIDGEITASPAIDVGNNTGVTNYNVVDNTQSSGGGGFISAWFDGKRKYYTCQNGQVITQEFDRGSQPAGWGTNRSNACLNPQQIAQKQQNTWSTIGNIFKSINTGFKTGVGVGSPNAGGGTGGGVIDPGATTTTTQAGMGGDTSKVIGWVLVAGVVFGLGYMAIKAAGAPRPDFYND